MRAAGLLHAYPNPQLPGLRTNFASPIWEIFIPAATSSTAARNQLPNPERAAKDGGVSYDSGFRFLL